MSQAEDTSSEHRQIKYFFQFPPKLCKNIKLQLTSKCEKYKQVTTYFIYKKGKPYFYTRGKIHKLVLSSKYYNEV